jgi:UDP-N-acetylmuramate dehydrogenase
VESPLTIKNRLKEFIQQDCIQVYEPLSNHTYTKTGGSADILISPKSIQDVEKASQYECKYEIPITLLGNGSNVIVSDKGIRGITIHMVHIRDIKVEGNRIKVGSGASLIEVAKIAQSHALFGLEFTCGIPGTVGGALFMNAGAYGGDMSEVLIEAKVFTLSGQFFTLEKKDFQFGYRSSVFAKEKLTIIEATFQLEHSDPMKIKEKKIILHF